MKKKGYFLKSKKGQILTIGVGDEESFYCLDDINKIPDNILFSSIISEETYNCMKGDSFIDELTLEEVHINNLILCKVDLNFII